MNEEAEVLAGILGLPRVPFFELSAEGPSEIADLRIIDAEANRETVTIRFYGPWETETRGARKLLVRNLAHELSHVWQYSLGEPTENAFFHEGFAEAMATETLVTCGSACGASPQALIVRQRSLCAEDMQAGIPLRAAPRSAGYGCGAVMVRAAADAAEISARELYRQFAAGPRDDKGFVALCEKAAGRRFSLSTFTFLHQDHRLASSEDVIARLRAGRL